MKKRQERFQIKDSGLIIDLVTGKTFSTNTTGLAIFRGFVDGKSRTELIQALQKGFEVDRETAGRDIDEFLGEMKALHLHEH